MSSVKNKDAILKSQFRHPHLGCALKPCLSIPPAGATLIESNTVLIKNMSLWFYRGWVVRSNGPDTPHSSSTPHRTFWPPCTCHLCQETLVQPYPKGLPPFFFHQQVLSLPTLQESSDHNSKHVPLSLLKCMKKSLLEVGVEKSTHKGLHRTFPVHHHYPFRFTRSVWLPLLPPGPTHPGPNPDKVHQFCFWRFTGVVWSPLIWNQFLSARSTPYQRLLP